MAAIELGDTAEHAVIEFGGPGRPSRRRRLDGLGRALADDRRVAPLCAGLAAVGALASLVSEWQVTSVDGSALGNGELGEKVIPADLADLGSFGAGYLVGLLLLAVAVVLTLAGPVAGRAYARLSGLAVGGTLLGLLLALTSVLGDQSRIVSRLYTVELSDNQLKLAYGRGLWCALFAVLAAVAALYLSGRRSASRVPRQPVADEVPDTPFELTVSQVQPFTSASDNRDGVNGSGRPGISG